METMHLLREKIYRNMLVHTNPSIVEAASRCNLRLLNHLSQKHLSEHTVLVAYGGGKDSSYMVAFVRLMQILLFKEYKTTFQLRVTTNRHAGMPDAVMENIDRAYKALGLYDDPTVELLLIDVMKISPFTANAPLPEYVRKKNRMDILMAGHRCEGEARPTFCNACNLSMVNSFGLAVSYRGGVDVVITGDSKREQRDYMIWVRQIATQLGIPVQKKHHGMGSFLHTVNDISRSYYRDMYADLTQEQRCNLDSTINGLPRDPVFFSVYGDTTYKAEDHWDLLTVFLGFQFDDLAFSFTESDCANPGLMAHLRGLKAQHVYGRTYEEGILEYMAFAIDLMQKKEFPTQLIELMKSRYASSEAVIIMKEKMNRYAKDTFDLSEEQLICMLYSPFVRQGKNLSCYLSRQKPQLYPLLDKIHNLLADEHAQCEERQFLEQQLFSMTHLEMDHLRVLYAKDFSLGGEKNQNPIALILKRDPHKALINTRHDPDGPIISELITGR